MQARPFNTTGWLSSRPSLHTQPHTPADSRFRTLAVGSREVGCGRRTTCQHVTSGASPPFADSTASNGPLVTSGASPPFAERNGHMLLPGRPRPSPKETGTGGGGRPGSSRNGPAKRRVLVLVGASSSSGAGLICQIVEDSTCRGRLYGCAAGGCTTRVFVVGIVQGCTTWLTLECGRGLDEAVRWCEDAGNGRRCLEWIAVCVGV